MSQSEISSKPSQMLEEILTFVEKSVGLKSEVTETGIVSIEQSVDGKIFRFASEHLSEVLQRFDADGKQFIQINFQSGLYYSSNLVRSLS